MDQRCVYCGSTESQTGRKHHREHFVPRRVGGEEIVTACAVCNLAKGGRVFATVEDCRVWLHFRFWQSRRRRYRDHRKYAFGGNPPSGDEVRLATQLDLDSRRLTVHPNQQSAANSTARPLPPTRTMDDVATEIPERKLLICGRPKPGRSEPFVIVEEPGDPVLVHFSAERRRQVPHYRANCPNCDGTDPKPLWYCGCYSPANGQLMILELTEACKRSAEAVAAKLQYRDEMLYMAGTEASAIRFRGLLVEIRRADFASSPRILRCNQRVTVAIDWPYETRRELARIWGVPVKPRIFREEQA